MTDTNHSTGGNVPPAMGGNENVPGQAGGRKKTAWMTHVKATMRAHKGMKLMQVLKMAKKTYKKAKKGMKGGSYVLQPLPLAGGRRGTRRSRRRGGNGDSY
jgi:hypothetical protein